MSAFIRLRQTFALCCFESDRIWYVLRCLGRVFPRVLPTPGITKLSLSCEIPQVAETHLWADHLKWPPIIRARIVNRWVQLLL